MKAFIYDGELYLRGIPGKRLFNSTMVHDVVNRGNVFAVRVSDSQLTIIPGTAEVEHRVAHMSTVAVKQVTPMPEDLKQKLAEYKAALRLKDRSL